MRLWALLSIKKSFRTINLNKTIGIVDMSSCLHIVNNNLALNGPRTYSLLYKFKHSDSRSFRTWPFQLHAVVYSIEKYEWIYHNSIEIYFQLRHFTKLPLNSRTQVRRRRETSGSHFALTACKFSITRYEICCGVRLRLLLWFPLAITIHFVLQHIIGGYIFIFKLKNLLKNSVLKCAVKLKYFFLTIRQTHLSFNNNSRFQHKIRLLFSNHRTIIFT